MKKIYITLTMFLLSVSQISHAQKEKTDANIIGHVICSGEHLPFVSISIKGTTIGTLTDETGHYQLINLPVGTFTIAASSVGYKTKEIVFSIEKNQTREINFELEEDLLNLSEVIISADRSEQKRNEAPALVTTIPLRLFVGSHSLTLGEGLNFCPGLRLENNCQNCGFTQVRMNGMEGPYSQILINSRPIFSGLAGVYGLELIPSNMIDRVEIVRGGGSALFGSNAIAGTINMILKDPVNNIYEIGFNTGLTGVGISESVKTAPEYSVNFNTSLVSDDRKTGVAVYGFSRERKMFDANGDGFNEIAPINNLTIGSRFTHSFGSRSKLSVDFFNIKEKRDGGNRQDYPLHERDIAEAVRHDIKTGALTFERFFREYDMFSLFVSGQHLNRDSYYGANRSLSAYGNSKDMTYNAGLNYKAIFGNHSIVAGIENTGGFLSDIKLGYPDYDNATIINDSIVSVPHIENTTIADQSSVTTGIYVQYELKLFNGKIALGGRYDNYRINDRAKSEPGKKGNVFSPRISLMYKFFEFLQARTSYSQGYRAPQIFDEDLHIETSGVRQIINVNDPDLKQETSHSIMASLDFNKLIGKCYTGLLLEGFYTRLTNPFVNEIGTPDEHGTVLYTRKNAINGATVQGINIELKLNPVKDFSLYSGFTLQSSKYDRPQEFDEKQFFRTPGNYGFFTVDWNSRQNLGLSITGNYTGKMLVPYFGTETDPDEGELRKSDSFYDLGIKLLYNIKINGATLQWFAGIKNIFNAYQSDFDKGINRDPSYIYGPVSPRAVYLGVKIGNMLSHN
jgi:outer membrane receptor for ferrienterochelin and colicins